MKKHKGFKKAAAVFVLAGIAAVSVLAGCKGGGSEGSGNLGQTAGGQTAQSTQAPEPGKAEPGKVQEGAQGSAGGREDIVIATAMEPTVFFCQDSMFSSNQAKDSPVLFQIYECLLWMDENGQCQPWLATGYDMSDDGLEYVFTLRDDVYFHNGEKMTAEDVAFTYNLCKEKNKNLTTNLLINFDKAEAQDDTHVKFTLTAPFGGFPAETSARVGFIINKKYYDEVGSEGYNENPVGTGPYTFESRISGQEIVLKAFEQYWGGEAGIKTVRIRPISNVSTQFISLKSGDVDVVNAADVSSCKKLTDSDIATWMSVPSAARTFIQFNVRDNMNSPAKDLNLRKAIQCAVNKEELVYGVLDGQGVPLEINVVPGYTGAPDPGTYPAIEYDPEKAKEYLAQSGYTGTPLVCLCQSGTDREMAAQIIQGQLMEVGINVEIVATDTGNYTASSQSGNYDMMIAMTSSSLYDVSSTNTEYRIQDTTGPIWPLADELDALCAKANVEVDPDARKALTAEVYTVVQENAYTVGLYGSESTMAYNKNLEGITLNPNNAWRVYNWSWK